jgi:hypothetical protein
MERSWGWYQSASSMENTPQPHLAISLTQLYVLLSQKVSASQPVPKLKEPKHLWASHWAPKVERGKHKKWSHPALQWPPVSFRVCQCEQDQGSKGLLTIWGKPPASEIRNKAHRNKELRTNIRKPRINNPEYSQVGEKCKTPKSENQNRAF